MKKRTMFLAAVLAVAATVLAAGLAVVPSTVQNVQANPCSGIGIGSGDDVNFKCKFTDDVEIFELPVCSICTLR
jgi:hypothetical protein